ncbi:RodZ domain-containing protein [Leptolyngbya sp. FACHB-261]|uniref:helix-turn-helix domain-containing protein n=1 Tax=Leptolyngbya sp. FACHB-261 TaxID=2692806 RepID=UPI001683902B|nr:RodZ domain-containing protein [Leptolyngbya sp. FACHB-261]MBD2099929.1 helix-turn-helix domain-containing protein [Leptolyngbya sp. FACHB-261]
MADPTKGRPSEFPLELDLQQQQAEILAELGSLLRQQREHQGLSVEDISGKTLINPRHLRSIEDGRLDLLPEAVYIRGFIRRFADAVALNGNEIASTFPASLSLATVTSPQSKKQLPSPISRLPAPDSQVAPFRLHLPTVPVKSLLRPPLSWLALGLCSLGLLALAQPALQQLAKSDPLSSKASSSKQATKQTALPPSPVASQLASNAEVKVAATGATSAPVKLSVTLKDKSWVRVVADGKKEFEGTLPAGKVMDWSAQERIVLRVGNGAGVVASVNNQAPKPLGSRGEVVEFVASADPDPIQRKRTEP